MCGIFCIASSDRVVERPLVSKLTDTLSHRGPDDAGVHVEEGVGLGHRRLSIIDLDGGHQPVFNEDGTLSIVFNGEIYNFMELKDELCAKGHVFATKSDTETILHAYEEWGEACVDRLRGMFSFAIWDRPRKRLFCARDRLGIKPFFYATFGGTLLCASEMKAILSYPGFKREMDTAALAAYFDLSYIPAPLTIYKGIRKLPPGHTLTWEAGKARTRKYWDLTFNPDTNMGESELIDRFMDLLSESVRIHLITEVPLGAFLSGGVDSGTIVALMAGATSGPVNTFCIGFGGATGGYLDERAYARMIADRYSLNHRDYEVTPDLGGIVDKVVRAFDEPFADDSSIPSYFVCKMARENVTVALSGLGGDEIFTGYERHLGFRLRSVYQAVPKFLRNGLLSRLVDRLPERSDGHYTVNHAKRFIRSGALPYDECYIGYLTKMSPAVRSALFSDSAMMSREMEAGRSILLGHFNSENVKGGAGSLDRALYCDIKTYLPEDILAVTDRMSMQHSLEVRVPFLDHKFMEFCANIPSGLKMKGFKKKYLLKKAATPLLPEAILTHRKQGFVGPMASWLKNDLREYARQTLSEKALSAHGLLNPVTVKKALDDHFSGREIHDTLIWSLIVFQKWYEMYMEGK